VKTGDLISLDVPGRRVDLLVDAAELEGRRKAWKEPAPRYSRGFGTLYLKHVTQANEGCDFDFLEAGAATPDPEIH
jgi:dihydroxyacid dehydratase/phosphogluconate dehydratase